MSVYILVLERQRKVATYYERQKSLLKGFNEVDSYNELGIVPGPLTEVCLVFLSLTVTTSYQTHSPSFLYIRMKRSKRRTVRDWQYMHPT